MSAQAARAARESRTRSEKGLRDMGSPVRGKDQGYTSHKRTKCPFLCINCRFLIKMCRIPNISLYPRAVHGIIMGRPSPNQALCSLRSFHLDFFATWST